MNLNIVTLQGGQLLNAAAKERIFYLLSHFSDKHRELINDGELNSLYEETVKSSNAFVCVAVDDDSWRDAGMYVGTVKPAFLAKNLYIDAVVVEKSFRGQGVAKLWLVPHMIKLAKQQGCAKVELTSSRPLAQSAYKANGFVSPTTAFRFTV